MRPPSVEVTSLTIDLPGSGHSVVRDVSLTVTAGEIVGMVGESGSGKTSIGLAMLGFARDGARLAGGAVRIDGDDLLAMSADDCLRRRGRTVAYVAQDPATALNPALRIGRQLQEMLETHEPGCSRGDGAVRIGQMMTEVGLPSDEAFLGRFPHQISGGQQQRVCIAMAFLLGPSIVVLDEPTTGLDVITQAKVLELVRRMCVERDVAALYISHDLSVVADVADRVVVLYGGEVVEEGDRNTVLQSPRHPYTCTLLKAVPDLQHRRHLASIPGGAPSPGRRPDGCGFHPRCPLATEQCAATRPELVQLGGTHRVRCHRLEVTEGADAVPDLLPDLRPASKETPALAVAGLGVAYGDQVVIADVGFEVARGECLAIVGESGSGKTTLSHALAGLIVPTAGVMTLDGAPLPAGVRNRPRAARQAVQYVFQNPYGSLNPRATVQEILTKPLRVLRSLDRRAARDEAADALDRVGLATEMLERYPRELSGGERQRVALARAVACKPAVLLCDEVTSALDVSAQAAVVELLRQLVDELDLALVFVTHDLALVRTIAERTAVLQGGRIVEVGETARVIAAPEHPYSRSLVEASPSLVRA